MNTKLALSINDLFVLANGIRVAVKLVTIRFAVFAVPAIVILLPIVTFPDPSMDTFGVDVPTVKFNKLPTVVIFGCALALTVLAAPPAA